MKITAHFSVEELCKSSTAKSLGITNSPNQLHVINLTALCVKVLEPLREWWGKEVKIGSGFRCIALNRAVGGVQNSQHIIGQAADLCIDGDIEKGKKWFAYIRDHLEFDQLIWEHNPKTGSYWVHVSYDAQGRNRHQVVSNLEKK